MRSKNNAFSPLVITHRDNIFLAMMVNLVATISAKSGAALFRCDGISCLSLSEISLNFDFCLSHFFFAPTGAVDVMSGKFEKMGSNFFDPKLTRPKRFQTERTQSISIFRALAFFSLFSISPTPPCHNSRYNLTNATQGNQCNQPTKLQNKVC